MTHSKRNLNFAAGPAALPEEVLQEAASAVLDYQNSGSSILEIAHRGPEFEAIKAEANALVLKLCQLNAEEYEVLWLQGGGRLQFAMIPMNFLAADQTAGYIDSGFWAADAIDNARLWGKVSIVASSQSAGYAELPKLKEPISEQLSYLHITTNNTICGTQSVGNFECPVPLIADMSSDIFSEQRDYSRFDLFYAVAQKNLGIAGVTLVVLRKSLLTKTVRTLNPYLSYAAHVQAKSVLNTAPVFAVYTALLMLRYIDARGIATIEAANKQKAAMLYAWIEASKNFYAHATPDSRSSMNVVFHAHKREHESQLIAFCRDRGITGIEGHRKLGGLRISLYNVISREQVAHLLTVLNEFEQTIKHA